MKTAVTVLQEMMVKMSQTPDYECISQSGPQHQAMFSYRCSALGAVVTADARSKKEAKQEAARLMLRALAARNMSVPPPYGLLDQPGPSGSGVGATSGDSGGCSATGAGEAGGGGGARSYVALLQELCAEYGLAGAEYELVGDTGPPHLRHFTITARVGQRAREATATTKKAARQLAAEKLYCYLRENLARLTSDFVEEEALVRAHEKAMERYLETREERRPDLGQKMADYHLGLISRLDDAVRESTSQALERGPGGEEDLVAALAALGLTAGASVLCSETGGSLHVVTVESSPPLAFAGVAPEHARAAAVRYLRRALRQHPPARDSPAPAAAAHAAPVSLRSYKIQ